MDLEDAVDRILLGQAIRCITSLSVTHEVSARGGLRTFFVVLVQQVFVVSGAHHHRRILSLAAYLVELRTEVLRVVSNRRLGQAWPSQLWR